MKINPNECIACGNCAEICDHGAIDIETRKGPGHYMQYKIDQDKCVGCGVCKKNCLNEAIHD